MVINGQVGRAIVYGDSMEVGNAQFEQENVSEIADGC